MPQAPEITWQQAVGRMFTARREELDLHIHEIAFRVRQVGVTISPDVVGRIMRGERANPTVPQLAAIADVLNIDQDEWLQVARRGYDGESTPSTCTEQEAPDLGLLAA